MSAPRIALALLLAVCASAQATDGIKMYTDEEGLQYWIGVSTDTKPTASTLPPGSQFLETDTKQQYRVDDTGSWVSLATLTYETALQAGEDQTNNVMRVEGQFSFCIDDADVVCKASAGFVHSVWCYPEDAAATAGTVRVTNTTAAGGAETTEVWGMDFAAAANLPVGQVLDIIMTTGIVIDFTTTADMKCAVSYR